MTKPWDATGETELEYCRRIAKENEPQTYRLHIKEESTGIVLSNEVWKWRMASGAAVSIEGQRYRVRRIVPHPALKNVDVVWVEREK